MIFEIKPILIEKVRLSTKGNHRIIDNKNGAWYQVIWFNSGDFELHALSKADVNHINKIPFNPCCYDRFEETGWE